MAEHPSGAFEVQGALSRALGADSSEDCAKVLAGAAERFAVFRQTMPEALRGEWPAVVVLVNHWHALVQDVAAAAAQTLPEAVQALNGGFGIVTAGRQLSAEPIRHLDHLIAEVPFSPLLVRFGPDVGVGVMAIDALRRVVSGCPALELGTSAGFPDLPEGADPDRFRRLVDLAFRSMQPPWARVKDLFGLTSSDVARLFGVSRQAVDQWEAIGAVPGARREKLANLLSVGELLERKLSPGRLALVARRRADAYGGMTMLDMVAADRDGELRALTEAALDWSGTA